MHAGTSALHSRPAEKQTNVIDIYRQHVIRPREAHGWSEAQRQIWCEWRCGTWEEEVRVSALARRQDLASPLSRSVSTRLKVSAQRSRLRIHSSFEALGSPQISFPFLSKGILKMQRVGVGCGLAGSGLYLLALRYEGFTLSFEGQPGANLSPLVRVHFGGNPKWRESR